MTTPLTLERLTNAITENAAAFRCRRTLQPAEGPGGKVFPPTFKGAVYAVEQRRIPGHADAVTCVVLDTVQSQANRAEAALQEALDAGKITIPVINVDFSGHAPDEKNDDDTHLKEPVGVITSLQVPHRLADAILRDSELEETRDGTKVRVPFRSSAPGKTLNSASAADASPVYRYCPTALLFGMWDSTGPKGGLGAKFERAMVSEVVGVNAAVSEAHKNRGVRRDPLGASKNVPILKSESKAWAVADDPKKKGVVRPSEINHGSVPFDSPNAGVTIDYAEQLTTISLIALRRLRFPIKGKTPEAQATANSAAQAVLAALGLCASALAFENGMGLRSRCLLWPTTAMEWELLATPGAVPDKFSLAAIDAVKLLGEAVKAATAAGITWEDEPVTLTPSAELVKLVRLSQIEGMKSDAETTDP